MNSTKEYALGRNIFTKIVCKNMDVNKCINCEQQQR